MSFQTRKVQPLQPVIMIVRQGGKKSGKILGKNPEGAVKQPGKPVRQVVRITTLDTREKSQKVKF